MREEFQKHLNEKNVIGSENLRVVLSKRIREHAALDTIRNNFQRYEGNPITLTILSHVH